ncbi:MAG: TolC family protein [Bacteroidales bacterium]
MKTRFIQIKNHLQSCTSRKRGSAALCFFMHKCLLWGVLCYACQLSAQVTLLQCRDSAQQNYPLIRQYDLIRQAETYSLSNAGKAWLPGGALGVQATLQSEVTAIPLSLPGVTIPELSKDQYRIQMEIRQMIYDGGLIRNKKEMIRASALVSEQKWKVDMYALNEQVDKLYFGILLLHEQLILNDLLTADLNRTRQQTEQALVFGVATPADVDAVTVSCLDATQQRINLEHTLCKYREMLSLLTGIRFSEATSFIRPSGRLPGGWVNHRPELALFDIEKKRIKVKRKQLTSLNLPVAELFMQGIYGRPGLNMLKNTPDWGWIGGIRISYTWQNRYTFRKDKLLLENEQLQVQVNQQTFLFNADVQMAALQTELNRIMNLMRQDDEIIRLRSQIVKASEAKLKNGTILINDLLRDIAAENSGRRQKCIHEIEYLQTIWQMKQLTNN